VGDDFDAETAGFTRYSTPSTDGDEAPGILYRTDASEAAGAGAAGAGAQGGTADWMTSPDARAALDGPRPDETIDQYNARKYAPTEWAVPADMSDAETAAYQSARGKMPGIDSMSHEEMAAYNRVAGANEGTQDRAGMDTVESFESQARMYEQIDDA